MAQVAKCLCKQETKVQSLALMSKCQAGGWLLPVIPAPGDGVRQPSIFGEYQAGKGSHLNKHGWLLMNGTCSQNRERV